MDMANPNSLVYVILYQQTANAALGAMPIAAFAVITPLKGIDDVYYRRSEEGGEDAVEGEPQTLISCKYE